VYSLGSFNGFFNFIFVGLCGVHPTDHPFSILFFANHAHLLFAVVPVPVPMTKSNRGDALVRFRMAAGAAERES
tara:strand:- start:3697 stop:3918 length:222 start_codon:yes stop_codon:yes gene_type:complete